MGLQPEELLLAAFMRRAIKDAQEGNERIREEARKCLWEHAPRIAERAGVVKQRNIYAFQKGSFTQHFKNVSKSKSRKPPDTVGE
jgi:hypothetical protein